MNAPVPPPTDFGSPDPSSAPQRPEASPPQVFSRVFSTPAGMPWEQGRAALLDVRHGAPLPIAELMHQLKRLDPWSPGRPSRFAVFYIRAREFKAPFETVVEVDGRPIRVAFGTPAEKAERAQRIGVIGLAAAVGLTVALAGGWISLSARAQADARMDLAEQTVAAKVRLARTLKRQSDRAEALQVAVGRSGRIDDLLADLAWASTAKTDNARIVAVHWQNGMLALEARGEDPPISVIDRQLQKSTRPIRPGVWLWGVERRGAPAAVPVAASGPGVR